MCQRLYRRMPTVVMFVVVRSQATLQLQISGLLLQEGITSAARIAVDSDYFSNRVLECMVQKCRVCHRALVNTGRGRIELN